MKMVFALTGNGNAQAMIHSEQPPNVLCSQLWIRGLEKLPYEPGYVLLDSGAFSAWNAGTPVNLPDYQKIALGVKSRWPLAWIINLDVIPGEAGRTATGAEIEAGMVESLTNADRLREAGLRVVEVFHQNEPFLFLDTLIARRSDERAVIGLSPRNDVSVKARCDWLKSVLGHLVRTVGVKRIPRFHGLAATGRAMLETFPFYSVDSSSWVNAYRFGIAIDERGKNTKIEASGVLPGTRCPEGQDLVTRRGIRNLEQAATEITRLWETRGVVWSD